MIRFGNTIVNEDEILTITELDTGDITVIFRGGVSLSLGISLDEAHVALVKAGLIEPLTVRQAGVFLQEELAELGKRYAEGFHYAGKDKDGTVWAYSLLPKKGAGSWLNDDAHSKVVRLEAGPYAALFFDDELPLAIEGALEGVLL